MASVDIITSGEITFNHTPRRPHVRFALHTTLFGTPGLSRGELREENPSQSNTSPRKDWQQASSCRGSANTRSSVIHDKQTANHPKLQHGKDVKPSCLDSPASPPFPSPSARPVPPNLPFGTRRRRPARPDELQSTMHVGHFSGTPLQGTRVPLPDMSAQSCFPHTRQARAVVPNLPLETRRRRPARPDELQSGMPGGHFVGTPFQGPRVPLPDMSAQSTSPHPQQTSAVVPAPAKRSRTQSIPPPPPVPVIPDIHNPSTRRHSWPKYHSPSAHVHGCKTHYLLSKDSVLNWDIRQDPGKACIVTEGGLLLSDPYGRFYRPDLSETAICTGSVTIEIDLSSLRLRHDWPKAWGPIIVRSTHPNGVRLRDILDAVYCHFHQTLTRDEVLEISSDSQSLRRLKDQYSDRYYLNGLRGADAFRRSDLLEWLTKFKVLNIVSSHEEVCFATLHLQPCYV